MRLGTIILTATLLIANSASAVAQRLTHIREASEDFIVEMELTYDKAGRLVKEVQEAYEPEYFQANYNAPVGNISYSAEKGEYMTTVTYSTTYENNKVTTETTTVGSFFEYGEAAPIIRVATLENGRVVSEEVSTQGMTFFTNTYAYDASGQLVTLTHTSHIEEENAAYDSFVINFTWSGGNIVSATAENSRETYSMTFNYTSLDVPANDHHADCPFRQLDDYCDTEGMESLYYYENLLGARNKNLIESIDIITTYKDKSLKNKTENDKHILFYQYDGNTLVRTGEDDGDLVWVWELTWDNSYTGIKPQTDAPHADEQYNLTGARANKNGKGLRLVRQKDGSVRKVVVR